MTHSLPSIKLLGILGTQEIIILIIIAIPILLGIWLFRFLTRKNRQFNRIAKRGTAAEIQDLFALKEKGIITEEEFNNKKAALLK